MLLRAHPSWADLPVAVLSGEGAGGRILECNDGALGSGIRLGDPYGKALSLCPILRAQSVPDDAVSEHTQRLYAVLNRFSPAVSPCPDDPGIAWLDCRGLGRLFPTIRRFIAAVKEGVAEEGLLGVLCVGFTRAGTWALVHRGDKDTVCRDPQQELLALGAVPLSRFLLPGRDLETLRRLHILTVRDLLRLPGNSLPCRFGDEVLRLHRRIREGAELPSAEWQPDNPPSVSLWLPSPDADAERLLFAVKQLLDRLLPLLATAGHAAGRLFLTFCPVRGKEIRTDIAPASPTLEARVLLELIRLRLGALSMAEEVERIALSACPVAAPDGQLALFIAERGRNLDAAMEGVARLRAAFGDCVYVAITAEGHLPESRWSLQPLETLPPAAAADFHPVLQRRLHGRPVALNTRPVKGPAGIHLGGLDREPVREMRGPHRVNGGWWQKEIDRDYYYATTESRRVLWVYFDRLRRRWFLHGSVE